VKNYLEVWGALTVCDVRPISQGGVYTRSLSHLGTEVSGAEKVLTVAKTHPTNPTGNGLNFEAQRAWLYFTGGWPLCL